MGFNLSDYTAAFRCNEGNDQNLVDFGGTQNWTQVGTGILSEVGKVEDPQGSILGRGWIRSIGSASAAYFSDPFSAGDIWDIRGQTSCTFAGWFLPRSTVNGVIINFSIHDASVATGQAFQLYLNEPTTGTQPSPLMLMFDGITPFNVTSVQANGNVAITLNTWNFVAGGYDASRNKIFNFWGRATGESYYSEADGFAAGFGYTGVGASNGLGEFGTGSAIRDFRADQCLWWNGRALNQGELSFLWNNHVGRALANLVQPSSSLLLY